VLFKVNGGKKFSLEVECQVDSIINHRICSSPTKSDLIRSVLFSFNVGSRFQERCISSSHTKYPKKW